MTYQKSKLLTLIFANGYVSLSLELLVLRVISFYVGAGAVITSIIMGVFLGFMSGGYFVGQSGRINDDKIPRIICASMLIIAVFIILSASFAIVSRYFDGLLYIGVSSYVMQTFIFALVLLSVVAFLFGLNTTLLSRLLHRYNTKYVGVIMAVDTIGSVMGSLLTTLLLMPIIGVNYTVVLICLFACLGAVLIKPRWYVIAVSVLILFFGGFINTNVFLYKRFGIIENNANSTILVEEHGNKRVLNMNGVAMSVFYTDSMQAAGYINYVNSNFIYNMPRDRKYNILVLGAGGFTAGLSDDFHNYTFVDIEHTLKDVSENQFLNKKLGNNKKFVVMDAIQFLIQDDAKYDLILLDVYSSSYRVPADFVTADFMMRVKSHVAPNGIVLMNVISSPDFSDAYTRVFDNTFRRIFTHNTSRYVLRYFNPWVSDKKFINVIYAYYNRGETNRIYTVNKMPVFYDNY